MSSSTSTNPSNAQSTENFISLSNKPLSSNLSHLCSVKLDRKNLLLWESSILPIIKGHRLDGHITGTKICPQKFITEGLGTKVNPAFDEWTAIDQLLLVWIYNILTVEIASQVIGCRTSQELWSSIKSLAGAQTHARVTFLKGELHRTRKGNLKMADYLAKMKLVANNLFLAGSPISTNDLVTQTLAGLDIDYNPIVVQLSNKEELTWVELQVALLTYENRMEQLTTLTSSLQVQANIANTKPKYGNNNKSDQNSSWRAQN